MRILRVLLAAVALSAVTAESKSRHSRPKTVGSSTPTSMARARAGWYSLTVGDLQKKVGATRRERWPHTDSTFWHLTSGASAARVVRARLTLTPPHFRKT